MTVIKLTKSKKAVQIITDEGLIYQTSVNSLTYLLQGKAKGDFITTIRLPFNASPDRYKPSEVWTDNGRIDIRTLQPAEEIKSHKDALSPKGREERQQKKAYQDISIEDL